MFDKRPKKDYEDEPEEVVWDLSDHSSAPPAPRTSRAARTPTAQGREEDERVVYTDDVDPHIRKIYLAIAICGVAVGIALGLLISSRFGFHGVLTNGVTPVKPGVSFYRLTPDAVRGQVNLVTDFHTPSLLDDLSMYVEHGEGSDNLTENAVFCSIYEDADRQKVFGVEFSVDASSRAEQDENKIQDTAQRLFQEAMQMTGSDRETERAERWAQIALRKTRRIGAVCQASFGDATLTCYGTPWTRTLLVTPR